MTLARFAPPRALPSCGHVGWSVSRALAALVMLALLGSGASQGKADALEGIPTPARGPEAVWLRINGVFVLQLVPRPPHLVNDSLVVPSRPTAHLLGLDHRLDEKAQRATFRHAD